MAATHRHDRPSHDGGPAPGQLDWLADPRDAAGRRAVSLIATLAEPPADRLERSPSLEQVACLEVRADLVGAVDPAWLRQRFPGRLLYTLRSRAEGGRDERSSAERGELLAAAAAHYDLVDLEAERDCNPATLSRIPQAKRVLSWHGKAADAIDLRRRFEKLAGCPAALYKLVSRAQRSGDELASLELLRQLDRRDVIAFATGELAVWTRLVAPLLGARVVLGALTAEGAPGQPTIERLVRDYGLPALSEPEALYGIVGNPVRHSLSPRLHNGAYRALGVPALYLPFHVESFGDFWLEVVEGSTLAGGSRLGLRGLSVTSPYKSAALAIAGASSPLAQRVDSGNTLLLRDDVWEAETTDLDGVILPLRARGLELRGVPVAVVGCGGAGRAAAAGLVAAGARVVLVNRTDARGQHLANLLRVPFLPLAELDCGAFDVMVNATSVGGSPDEDPPWVVARMKPGAVVVDMVYGSIGYGGAPTRLVEEARAAGRIAVPGLEVLLYQALEQFRLMTGRVLAAGLGAEILGVELTSERGSEP